MSETIVSNLEVNVNRLIAAIERLPKVEAEQGICAAIEGLEMPETNLGPVIDEIRLVAKNVSAIKFPEVSFKTEKEAILAGLAEIRNEIARQELVVNVDLGEVVKLLTAINAKETEKTEFPTEYPLPKKQLEALTAKDDTEIVSALSAVKEAIQSKPVGGGGPDVVGIKTILPSGEHVQIHPMTEEKGEEIRDAVANIVVPAPVGGALESTQLQVLTAVQNPPAPPAPVGGATEATLEELTLEVEDIDREMDKILQRMEAITTEPDSGEALNIDTNLRQVFGTERVIEAGKVKVNPVPEYYMLRKNLPLILNSLIMMDVVGMNSLAIQVSGTWTGTLTFECSLTGQDFVALSGIAVNGVATLSTATVNGIYRFNIAGIAKVQVRFTAATTGSPQLLLIASPEASSIIGNTAVISGAVTSTSTDTVLPSSYTPQAGAARIIPVVPTTPTSGISNFLTQFPQIFNRLRVESGGSQRVPFTQEEGTYKLKTSDDETRMLLQSILRQLEILNNFTYQQLDYNGMKNLKIPEGFNEN